MDFISYLEERYDIKFVSGGSQVKVSGVCPFCGEDRIDLRLYVGVKNQAGICHHCETGFSPVKFVMAAENVSAKKAIKILNGDEDSFVKVATPEVKKEAKLIFPEMVKVSCLAAAEEYLSKRNICSAAIDHFKIRFCPSNTIINDKIFYTENRIIFPIYNIAGKLVSWQGRDITGESKIKYLFPPNFKGAEELYNVNNIEVNPKYLIVAEGIFDVLGWWINSAKNVIATFGKKISKAQVDMIRYINPAVLFMAWDSDALLQKYEFVETYGHYFSDIRIVELGGKDADELKKGALMNALLEAKPYSWEDKITSLI